MKFQPLLILLGATASHVLSFPLLTPFATTTRRVSSVAPTSSHIPTTPSTLLSSTSRGIDVTLGNQVLVNGSAGFGQSPAIISGGIVPPKLTEKEVRALFQLWNDALATGDSRIVARRYSSDPILLPTVSDIPRTDYDGIKDYFDTFLKLQPQGVILDGKIRIGNGWAQDAGIYEFTMGATGAKVKARYSFVYLYENGQWKILHHHSSQMPEGKADIEDAQVRNLFYLWNDALDTLDSDLVARRYAKNAVLLPTVSDTPRTDYAGIKDYFDVFLKLKPQGVILESFVTIGDGWCKDVGIYEFTMRANGNKVKARYSFVYVKEDGQWKIAHHHSSAMPEGGTPKITEEQVKSLFHLWNNALATLDSDMVARRYAKNAVLLPTVSDKPRTDYASIKDYFDVFLKNKPQGTILESYVQVGNGWCKDVGIYEFTMGATGDRVKGRYSFVYTYEDGEWKISHHHSSVMPEAYL
ncbi:hypothetical protein ACA910_009817 [Epithemia clementina (nom. ined.)]